MVTAASHDVQLRQRSSEPSVNGGPYQSAVQLAADSGRSQDSHGAGISTASES